MNAEGDDAKPHLRKTGWKVWECRSASYPWSGVGFNPRGAYQNYLERNGMARSAPYMEEPL